MCLCVCTASTKVCSFTTDDKILTLTERYEAGPDLDKADEKMNEKLYMPVICSVVLKVYKLM